MVDPKMVLDGLKACADRDGALCPSCPYKFVKDGCVSDMARDAFWLLEHDEEIIASLQNTINKLTKAIAEKSEVVQQISHIREQIHELINDGCCVDTDADKLYVLALIDGFFMQEAKTDK